MTDDRFVNQDDYIYDHRQGCYVSQSRIADRLNEFDGGAGLIARERARQISAEGWTAEHDSQWENEELVDAAITYLFGEHNISGPNGKPLMWPWAAEWYKPKDRVRDLVRAGALVAAEIDRLAGASIEFDFGSPHGENPPEEGPEVEIARLKAENERLNEHLLQYQNQMANIAIRATKDTT